MEIINISGIRFGRLVAISRLGDPPSRWGCRCDCGEVCQVRTSDLRSGNTTSCGCAGSRTTAGARTRTHGMSKTREYGMWQAMLNRCRNPSVKSFSDYGQRGILVCDRWSKFENFLADMGACPLGTTLERQDNDGNYEPSNCIWATRETQMNNRRNNIRLSYNGRTLTLAQWGKELGIPYGRLRMRHEAGLPAERILSSEKRVNQHG